MFSLNSWAANNIVLTKDNTIVMNNFFDSESVAIVAAKARELDAKIPSTEPMYIILDSGGGSIEAGIELIENLNSLNRSNINTLTLFSASMAFQTVQGVKGQRLLLENGTLMSHKARGMFYGEFPGQLDSRYQHYLKRVQRLDSKAVARTAGKQTDKSYSEAIAVEMWCDGEECVKLGYADSIVSASCDQSLKGSSLSTVDKFIYFGHTIEIVESHSNCPVITGALSWNILVDGQPLFSTDISVAFLPPKLPTTTSYYDYNKNVITTLGSETAENIKRLVIDKISTNTLSHRQVKFY
jgi:ATP-dependent protease ClpP protease subunit